MKKIYFILIIALFSACVNKGYRVARIYHKDTVKIVEVCWGDSTISDTTFMFPANVKDSSILKQLRVIEDSLLLEKAKTDSLYRMFQQDSINYRVITFKINGGYNGWDDRYKRWLEAREAIQQNYIDTVKN